MSQFIVITSVVYRGKLYLSSSHVHNLLQWRQTGVPMAKMNAPEKESEEIIEASHKGKDSQVQNEETTPQAAPPNIGSHLQALFSLPPIARLIEEAQVNAQVASDTCREYIEQNNTPGGTMLASYAKCEASLNAMATAANSWKALCDAVIELLTPVSSTLQH